MCCALETFILINYIHSKMIFRKITDKTDGKKSVRIILGELRDVYDTEPKRILGVGVSGVVQVIFYNMVVYKHEFIEE